MEHTTVLIVVGFILVLITVFAMVRSGSKVDDMKRWNALTAEMYDRYPNANYKAQLEFMRRDKYAAFKIAIDKNEDIAELTEDYQMILDEQERIDHNAKYIGAEFNPYVANQNQTGV